MKITVNFALLFLVAAAHSIDTNNSPKYVTTQRKHDAQYFPGSGEAINSRSSNNFPNIANRIEDFLNGKVSEIIDSGLNTIDRIMQSNEEEQSSLSSPEECLRECIEGEPPKTCYYHFTVELYSTLGPACLLCTPGPNNTVTSTCQCVLADGVERGFLSVNRMLPGPSIQVCKGDTVIVDVVNAMAGMGLTIHWHGLSMRETPYSDGVPLLTQCPIHDGNAFRYKWNAEDAGTHFWHAHSGLQKFDGISGTLIIKEPRTQDPNSPLYDLDLPEHVVDITDWIHDYAEERFPGRLKSDVSQNAQTFLINGKGRYRDPRTGSGTSTPYEEFIITTGNRYRFRMINSLASACPVQLTIEGHNLTIIATDGQPVVPRTAHSIISSSGERYDFIINADQPVGVYWMQVRGLGDCEYARQAQQLAHVRYSSGPFIPLSTPPTYATALSFGVIMNTLDGFCDVNRTEAICVNQLQNAREVDPGILQETPDVKIYLPFSLMQMTPEEIFKPNTYKSFLAFPGGTYVTSLVNNISFQFPTSPPLSQMNDIDSQEFCNGGNMPADCDTYCKCTHMIDVPLNAVVEVVLIDEVRSPNQSHPFHLHGYKFHVMGMGRSPDQNVTTMSLQHAIDLDRRGLLQRNFNRPPGKDTIMVPSNGYVVLRFRADNPGYWLFHCHYLYHIVIGMNFVVHVGSQSDLPPVPLDFPKCNSFLPPITLK